MRCRPAASDPVSVVSTSDAVARNLPLRSVTHGPGSTDRSCHRRGAISIDHFEGQYPFPLAMFSSVLASMDLSRARKTTLPG